MRHADMQVYRERLLVLRARLRGDVLQMADAALNESRDKSMASLSRMPIHMADLGTDAFEQEFTLRLVESEEETLERIEACLQRIDSGTYGSCEGCGAKIPKTRLNAIPYATFCVECASKAEQGGKPHPR